MNSIQIRDREARETLERMERDRDKVSERLKPALGAIIRDLFEVNLQLTNLWQKLGIRDHNISSHFVRELGVKPWAYVRDCRFEVATRMLKKTHVPIHQISLVLGYLNYQSFSRSFEQWYGVRPIDCRLGRDQRPTGPPPSETPLRAADRALAAGNVAVALDFLDQAEGKSRRSHVEARRALAYHVRGVDRALCGDVDRAFDDLRQAHRGYAAVKTLPARVLRHRQRLPISTSTDEMLLDALCPECRRSLVADDEVRRHLRRALELVPRDLCWFGQCCDPCYRVVWDALSRARLGQIQDAWQAWWISESADLEDPETPPSLGRYVAALARVERGALGDQKERKRHADVAVDDARELRQPLLEAQARIWRGSVLRALASTTAARRELSKAAAGLLCGSPWIAALRDRMTGILEAQSGNSAEGAGHLQSAWNRYMKLDPHFAGLVLIQEANRLFFDGEYEKSIVNDRRALKFLDSRRDPLPGHASVPVHLAMSLGCLGDWDAAEAALAQCSFDREKHVGTAAAELFTRGCLKLGRERPRQALNLFREAKALYRQLHRLPDVGLIDAYSVEAYVFLNQWEEGMASAESALSALSRVGCSDFALAALQEVQCLLRERPVAADTIRAIIRKLTRQNGGWLPDPT